MSSGKVISQLTPPDAYCIFIAYPRWKSPSLLWPVCSLPCADSTALQFNFSKCSAGHKFSHSGLRCVLNLALFSVCSAGPLALAEPVIFCTVLRKVDCLGIYWDINCGKTSWNIRKRFVGLSVDLCFFCAFCLCSVIQTNILKRFLINAKIIVH